MKLLTKFNLILIVLFGACGLIIAAVAYQFLINNASPRGNAGGRA